MAAACGVLVTLPFSHVVALRNALLAIGLLAVLLEWKRVAPAPPRLLGVLLCVWGALGLLSLSWAIDVPYSSSELKSEFVHCAAVFLIFSAVTTQPRVETFRRVLRATTVLSFASVGYWATYLPPTSTAGYFNGPGMYSTFLCAVVPFLLQDALDRTQSQTARVVSCAVLAGAIVAGALTLNRLFPIVVGLQIVILGIMRARRGTADYKHLVLLSVAVLGVTAALAIATSVIKFQMTRAPGDGLIAATGNDPRIRLWQFAVKAIADNPLSGSGFGRGSARAQFMFTFESRLYWHAHNVILNHGLAMGIPGMLLIVAIFGVALFQLARAGPGEDVRARFRIATFVAVTGILAKNMLDDFFYREGAMLFWALIAIALSDRSRMHSSPGDREAGSAPA